MAFDTIVLAAVATISVVLSKVRLPQDSLTVHLRRDAEQDGT
jgi:hypothetical protein